LDEVMGDSYREWVVMGSGAVARDPSGVISWFSAS
jgi:hypothetical protein